MKNDIDSILNSMFRDGRLNLKSSLPSSPPAADPAKQAAKAVEAVDRAQQGLTESLQESIERMAREAQEDMADLRLHLEQDGVSPQTDRKSVV